MRALLVDDSPVILQSLKAFLRSCAECDIADDGQKGLDAFRRALQDQRPYELVCLDLQMPEIDGGQLLGLIRKYEHEASLSTTAKILVITSTADADVVRRLVADGANGYLLKPVSEHKLREQLLALGLASHPAQLTIEKLSEDLGTLCDADTIPSVVLARLMRRMTASVERQALQDASAIARLEAELKAARAALAKKETPKPKPQALDAD